MGGLLNSIWVKSETLMLCYDCFSVVCKIIISISYFNSQEAAHSVGVHCEHFQAGMGGDCIDNKDVIPFAW